MMGSAVATGKRRAHVSTETNPAARLRDSSRAHGVSPEVISGAAEPEFATYLRELPRLLAEGHADHYALLKGNDLIGVWNTQREVLQAGYERFGLEPFSVKRIDPRDPERIAAIRANQEASCPP
jgi:hypothetical protein